MQPRSQNEDFLLCLLVESECVSNGELGRGGGSTGAPRNVLANFTKFYV